MIDLVLRSTLMLLGGLVAELALGRASAAGRHLVWVLALGSLLLLPPLMLAVPAEMALLPSSSAVLAPVDDAPIEGAAGSAPGPARARRGSLDAVEEDPRTDRALPGVVPRESASPAWTTIWSFLWASVGLAIVGRTVLGRLALGRAFARAEPFDARTRVELSRLGRRLGLAIPIGARISDEIALPLVFGFRRPRILLPRCSGDWDPATLEMVLLHELAHARRGDVTTLLLARLAAAVFWWHPLVWPAVARLRHQAECAADDLVLRGGARPRVYARALVEIARRACSPLHAAAAAGVGFRSPLARRIDAIVDASRRRGPLSARRVAAAAVAAPLLVVPLAAVPSASAAGTDRESPGRMVVAGDDCACSDDLPWWLADRPAADRSDDLDVLLDRVTNGDERSRAAAARALGDWHVARARGALRAALHDARPAVRAEAVSALGKAPRREDLDALLAALRDRSCRVSERAPAALAELGASRALSHLTDALVGGGCRLRVAAAEALASFPSDASRDALGRAALDADPRVRSTAISSLHGLGERPPVELLLASLSDPDGHVREEAVRTLSAGGLGVTGDDAVVSGLLEALVDPNGKVRQAAAEALARVGDERAVGPLLTSLADENEHVRQAAAEALGRLGDWNVVADLAAVRESDPNRFVRAAAADAVERLERAD